MIIDINKIPLGEYHILAMSPTTKPEILLALLNADNAPWLKKYIVSNPGTPIDTVLELFKKTQISIKKLTKEISKDKAKNNGYPDYKLVRLHTDQIEILAGIARNPLLPTGYLESLSKNPSVLVRRNLAVNKMAPADVLEKLSKDRSPSVRYDVANNPQTPTDVLLFLAKDPDNYIRHLIASRKDITTELSQLLLGDKDEYVREALAGNPKVPINLLVSMQNDILISVRTALASNPNTPQSILEKLLLERSTRIRRAIINNPSTSEAMLLGLEKKKKIPKTLELYYRKRIKSNIHL